MRGHRRVVSSLDPAFDALLDSGSSPLLRKAASAHVQPPSLEGLSLHDSSKAERTTGGHHPRDMASAACTVGASMPAEGSKCLAQT